MPEWFRNGQRWLMIELEDRDDLYKDVLRLIRTKKGRGLTYIVNPHPIALDALSFRRLHQNPDAEVNSQIPGIHVQVIIFRIAPLVRGERVVETLSSLVILLQCVFGVRLLDALPLDCTLYPFFMVGIDKHMQGVFHILQNIAGGSSDDHAVSFFGSLFDDALFLQKKLVRKGQVLIAGRSAQRGFGQV